MIADDFMFLVPKIWYRLYWGLMVSVSVLIVAGYGLARFVPAAQPIAHTFYLDSRVSLALASGTLIYLLVFYWWALRVGAGMATIIAAMFYTLVLLNGLDNATPGIGAYIYVCLWVTTVWMSGMFGLPILLGSAVLAGMLVMIESRFHIGTVDKKLWVLLGASLLTAGLSYLFWRGRYMNRQAQQMTQLSGMLRSNQEQSAILIQSIADGVIVINTEGKITLINPAAASMSQWPVSEAIGIDVQLVLKLAKEKGEAVTAEENPFKQVLTKKTRVNRILQLTGREGKQILISLVIAPISIGESNTDSRIAGAVAVIRDVSTERAQEQQRAEFISTASHEMRTPVAAIEGYLALALNDKVSTIDSRGRGFLEKAHASTQHLGQLFQDLLTSAKAEDGRLSNHPVVIEMGSYLQQLVEDLRFSAQKKGLAAEFVVGAGEAIDATNPDANDVDTSNSLKVIKPLYYVLADPDRLREVITNLFDNACKYTDQGKVSIGLTGNNEVVQFYIRDTGAGIPPEDIPHLFQKFYRVDNSATRTIGGTGLGLFISRKIIELYHGRIWVESTVGKGSTFFINLPRIDAQRAMQLQSQQSSAPASTTPPAKT